MEVGMSKPLRIVALGSSFAAGPGITPIEDTIATRSARNYAHIVAERLQAKLDDRSASGATLCHVLDERQKFFTTSLSPQLHTLDADVVFLTAGGNDIGYSLGMIRDSVLPFLGTLNYQVDLDARLAAVVKRVKELAPKAKMYLVEYLTVFGSDRTDVLNAERVRHYQKQAEHLARTYKKVADRYENVEVIKMSSLSFDHGVGSQTPWVTGFSWSMFWHGIVPYHPNREGHEAVAEAILAAMNKSG